MCHPMLRRQAYYKYILVVLGLSACLEFPRFFEIRLNKDKSQYWTTDLMENPYYVRFNSYWNELFATGLAPLISLCYMNLRIFLRIKVLLTNDVVGLIFHISFLGLIALRSSFCIHKSSNYQEQCQQHFHKPTSSSELIKSLEDHSNNGGWEGSTEAELMKSEAEVETVDG